MVTVSTGARLHVGFQNLSLAHDRLYGGVGVGLAEPRTRISAEPADDISVAGQPVGRYATRAVERLGVSGVEIEVESSIPRHVGLGSGTQLALAVYAATALAHDRPLAIRSDAPELGRGGRSGVGVATFERGGFVVDAGHPTARFTTAPPERGEWTVPPVVARHKLPESWRFVVVVPDATPGRSGDAEDASIRSVVEDASPAVADEIAGVLTRRLLPAAAAGHLDAFGDAVERIGRLNGTWYTETQGGVFRPPAGRLVEHLDEAPVLTGIGQSSWGPAVYGVTDRTHRDEAETLARDSLDELGLDGTVYVTRPAADGFRVHE
ncbi:beta-RFAP synthase [Halovivax ruber XH-70]|uniref:Beta-ribofuranosylaminobenzene 5'-phosphate synthase n=1 Tax=Halovivax ruber (strain DSM 18193 / JCM 13892 / XH-70) TaxID=797302 RepID=L0ICP7_HALRX|nr:beta-ribofuranosylaminobenzene 5'-phosphate synthase family protein [Halovivax ruber]AGB16608.1 beta-RFAP synthase [Halovivax ruber XH-70]